MKFFIDKKKVFEAQSGISIGLVTKTQVKLHLAGEMSLDEILDMLHTAEYEVLDTFVKALEDAHGANPQIRKDVHKRSVYGYSLMIDKFLPQAQDAKELQGTTVATPFVPNAKPTTQA